MEKFLGYDNTTDAVVVGVGSLGSSLLHYDGFSECGFRIVAGFDAVNFDEEPFKKEKPVFPMRKLGELCERLKVHLAVIAVPAESAQDVCDELVKSGILAILNFTPVHLTAGPGILIQDMNIASALAVLSSHIRKELL